MEINNISNTYPNQLLSDKRKDTKWSEDNVRYFSTIILKDIGGLRKRKRAVNDNYNVVVGKIRQATLEKANNPLGQDGEMSDVPQLFDDSLIIINPTINALIGEELKRNINWRAAVMNPEAISAKEKGMQEYLMQRLVSLVTANIPENEVEAKLQELQDDLLYSYQDIREKRASNLLNYYYEQLKLKYVFNAGFKDVLIAAEEIYRIDLISNEPRVTRCNPLTVYTIRTVDSNFIEDADAIIEDSYMTAGQIVAEFGDILTKKQIEKLYNAAYGTASKDGMFATPTIAFSAEVDFDFETLYGTEADNNANYNWYNRTYRNLMGEYRVMRVCWKSLREVYELTTIDPETGLELVVVLDSQTDYEPDPNKGEKLRTLYITDWWQGVRIGYDMYIDMKPCLIQRRDINNPFISYPPYVGTIYNVNDRTARSLVDELKPIQAEWSVFKKKLDLLWARNFGKLVRIDVSKIPDFGQNAEQNLNIFMNWITVHGIILENPFQEGAKGQLSGQFQSGVGVVDAELSTTITSALSYMAFLTDWADKVAGVNSQRRGQGAASEGLGVTEYRIAQSSNQTEEKFAVHDYTKLRVLEALLETIKYSMRNGNKKLQYITDDLSAILLTDGNDEIKDADFGIKIVSSEKVLELEQDVKRYAEYALNNGMSLSDILDVQITQSVSDKIMKLKKAERARQQQAQQAQQASEQMQQQVQQMQMQLEQARMQHELTLKQMELETKIKIEEMKVSAGAYKNMFDSFKDDNRNGIEDEVELEKQKLVNTQKEKELSAQEKEADKQRRFEAEQNEKERQNKLTISKNKKTLTK